MGKLTVPAQPKVYTSKYGNLRGNDFSKDPSLVDKRRSPMALNMISDNCGNPVKRLGWRVLYNFFDGSDCSIHNIWYGEVNGNKVILVHVGTKLYEIRDMQRTLIHAGLNSAKGTGFFMNRGGISMFFFTDGKDYRFYDGEIVGLVSDYAYRPKVIISRNPSGGGVAYEAANLVSGKKTASFLGNSTSKVYYLPHKNIQSVDGVKIIDENGEKSSLCDSWMSGGYKFDLEEGTVTLYEAHPPAVTGKDNVEIDYTYNDSGYADRISECTISALYGYGAINRAFLSGNPKYQSYDWCSGLDDPTYFPDTSYSIVGTSNTAIMGYLKLGEYLAIVKEDNQQDSTIFLRYGEIDGNGNVTFPTKQSIAGLGAASKYCFASLGDEPLFLSRRGVMAITSTLLNYDRVLKNRSFYLDKKLTEDKDLSKAVAREWNGYYVLSVNSHVYVLDGRHKSGDPNSSEYAYEGYYWENVPASCFLSVGGELYFGTEDGQLCKFNTDIDGRFAYNDGGTYSYDSESKKWNYVSGGRAIPAYWSTPNDDDGGVHYFKTLQKRGCLVVLNPFDRSSGKVCFIVDGVTLSSNPVASGVVDIFNFEDIDFERFSFDSSTSPRELYFNRKQKKYKRIQIMVMNDTINEPFGIHEIIKCYCVGNYSK